MKKVSVLALVLAVVLSLSGCQDSEFPKIAEAKKEPIQAAFAAHMGCPFVWEFDDPENGNVRYYGTFGDRDVIFYQHEYGSLEFELAGFTFTGDEPFSIYLVGENSASNLRQAVQYGKFSEQYVEEIWEAHTNRAYQQPTSEKKEHIKKKVLFNRGVLLEWCDDEDYDNHTRYYGSYDGYDVFYECPPANYGTSGTTYIGEYGFRNSGYFWIFAYKDGTLIPLEDAYEAGIISDKSMARICDVHLRYDKKLNPRIYEEQ